MALQKVIELKLYDEKEKDMHVYQVVGVSGQATYDAYKFLDEQEKSKSYIGLLESQIDYVVSLFKGQGLTKEKILSGVDSDKLIDLLNDVFNQVVGDNDEDGKK